jgi:HlyD family secretion protein
MKRVLVVLVLLGTAGGAWAWWNGMFGRPHGPVFRTVKVKRDDIQATISATGTLEPQEVVDVSAQITGQILDLGYDPSDPEKDPRKRRRVEWGTEVKEGTLLAQLDDKVFKARVVQAKANLQQAVANVLQARAKLDQAERDYMRAQRMIRTNSIGNQEYDAARSAYETSKALVEVNKALVEVARGGLQEAETNLGYTVIKSPVNGVIIDRRVNIGQTVVSNLNAQSMFLVAKDLNLMEIWASVNEADVGQIRVGQKVHFSVASMPSHEHFRGKVSQIRLNATSTSNVVTYTVVVSFDNSKEKLLPYLTASLWFEVAQRKGVRVLPNSALRWRPLARQVDESERSRWERYLRKSPGDMENTGMLQVTEGGAHDRVIVWVDNGQGFLESREIRIGQTDGRMTEVAEGLKEGDEVVFGVDAQKTRAANSPLFPSFVGKQGR